MKISNVIFRYCVGITFFALAQGAAAPRFSTPKKNAAKPAPVAAAAAIAAEPDFSDIIPGAMLENLIFQQADLLRDDPDIAFLFQKRIDGYEGKINSVAISPYDDDRFILTGSGDKKARIWNLDGSLRHELPHHAEGPVIKVAISPYPDDRFIITVTPTAVRLWDIDGVKTVPHRRWGRFVQNTAITSFALSPNKEDQFIVIGCLDGSVQIRNIDETGRQNWKAHEKPVLSIAVSPYQSDRFIVTGSEDKSAKMWNFEGQPLERPIKFKDAVTGAAISRTKNDPFIAVVCRNGDLNVCNIITKEQHTIKAHKAICSDVAIGTLENDPYIVTGAWNQSVRLWTPSEEMSAELNVPTGPVTSVAMSPYQDNAFVAFGSGKYLWLWDRNSVKLNTVKRPYADSDDKEEASEIISSRETVPVWLTLDNMLKLKELVREARANGNVLRPTAKQAQFIDNMPEDLRARFKAVIKVEEPKAKRSLFGGWWNSKKDGKK